MARSPDLRTLIAHIMRDAHAVETTLAHEVITKMGSQLNISTDRIIHDPFAYQAILAEMSSQDPVPHDSWFYLVQVASMSRDLYHMAYLLDKLAQKRATDTPLTAELAASAPDSMELFRVLRQGFFLEN